MQAVTQAPPAGAVAVAVGAAEVTVAPPPQGAGVIREPFGSNGL